jgi:hypothetical protein
MSAAGTRKGSAPGSNFPDQSARAAAPRLATSSQMADQPTAAATSMSASAHGGIVQPIIGLPAAEIDNPEHAADST